MNDLHPGFRLAELPVSPVPLSPGAVPEWDILAPLVLELGTCRGADLRALALLAELLADITALERAVRADGITTSSAAGSAKAHPALGALAAARRHAEQLLAKFGLVPNGRRAERYTENRANSLYN
jgi:P27 family predicted phage terminase small subunit